MSYNNILVPTDGSDNIKNAVDRAVELAKLSGGKITALYVIDKSALSSLPSDAAVASVYSSFEKEGNVALDYVKNVCAKNNVEVEVRIRGGSPVQEIIAESASYDIVIMGTLGRTGFSKILMGSVAESVVRMAACPVMVVRSKD